MSIIALNRDGLPPPALGGQRPHTQERFRLVMTRDERPWWYWAGVTGLAGAFAAHRGLLVGVGILLLMAGVTLVAGLVWVLWRQQHRPAGASTEPRLTGREIAGGLVPAFVLVTLGVWVLVS